MNTITTKPALRLSPDQMVESRHGRFERSIHSMTNEELTRISTFNSPSAVVVTTG
jgi:hypothetical protein